MKSKFLKKLLKAKDIKMPRKEFVEEHKRLISVLESPSHKDDVQEAAKQKKEVKEKLKKKLTEDGSWTNRVSNQPPAEKNPKNFNWRQLYHGQKTEEESQGLPRKEAKEMAMQNLYGDTDYYKNMKKSELDIHINLILQKAGKSGEGSRGGKVVGHTKAGDPIYESNRKPYPGEEEHNAPKVSGPKEPTYVPPGGLQVHYSDEPEMKAYKNLISLFKKEGIDFQGHLTFDPKTQQIKTLTPQADKAIKMLKEKYLSGGSEQPKKE